ncbi:LuxR C-terminal-related transcriptional regulator [Desulfobacterales bacterium HSG2]|nr:LuxR C-terminal-related transcriptional regulator [Desulfobacterales bacterium HSG2]
MKDTHISSKSGNNEKARTETEQLHEALQEQRHHNERILQLMADGFFMTDIEGRILKTNRSATMILACSESDILGRNIRDLRFEETSAGMLKRLAKIMTAGSDHFETEYRLGDGRVIDIDIIGHFIEGGNNRFFFFFRDVTTKQAEHGQSDERVGADMPEKTNVGLKVLTDRADEDKTDISGTLEEINAGVKVLLKRAGRLEEINAGLKVLMGRADEDRTTLEEKVLSGVTEMIVPFLERLGNTRLDDRQKTYVQIIKSNLSDIISPFSRKISAKYSGMTPTEIQVASLVKEGKTSKEIAEMMNLSSKTIEVHRKNIRKKMGLTDRKVNLRTYLLSL